MAFFFSAAPAMPAILTLFATLLSLLVSFAAAPALAQTPRWETLPLPAPLPALAREGRVERGGASIWFGEIGKGKPIILLHGGRASSLGWGNQVDPLVKAGRRVILVDSRGHGRSTLGPQALSYELMADDVLAVMDSLKLRQADVAGWSDGANIGLIIAMRHPRRVGKVFALGPNMNARFITPPVASPILPLVGPRLASDYASIAPDPSRFEALSAAVRAMQSGEPDYTDAQLAAIRGGHVAIVAPDHDEFISRAHSAYLAATIPGAQLVVLQDVSHFAPWQDPAGVNAALFDFLRR
ncbi:alpha/beta fold hydrolase [Massilia sp. KIM]|uniref:alpha/beta fold hydrolase n=1 Tax=Massilia sp. KIM TaxID=1955422 RepID=UPI001E3AD78A|nr:alpha/beta fold hydrolase [Massilia sp. KIM]